MEISRYYDEVKALFIMNCVSKLISNYHHIDGFLSALPRPSSGLWGVGKEKRKVGGIHFKARSRGRSSPDTLAF